MTFYISNPSKTAEILKKYNIHLKKSLGQNFLIDTNILKKIVRLSGISPCDAVLEIGSGIGSLTQHLMGNASLVVCLEIDRTLAYAFRELFTEYIGKNILLVQDDAMNVDYPELADRYKISKIIANLPYKIAAPVLMKILIEAPQIKRMYLTIQKDIAERICSKKGDKNYSSYTVKANYLADFRILFNIQRTCFLPVPFVDSSFIEVIRKDASITPCKDFFNFIDACFLHRRKKLKNSLVDSGYFESHNLLQNGFRIDKMDLTAKMLRGIGKDPDIRAEELELKDFIELFISFKAPET